MNKQKEIRKGLITKIESIRAWGGNPDDPLSPEDDVADILRYLDRKGVVIKVDRELGHTPQNIDDWSEIKMEEVIPLVATEPLVGSHKPEEKEE